MGKWVPLIKADPGTLGTFPKVISSKTDHEYYFRMSKVKTPRSLSYKTVSRKYGVLLFIFQSTVLWGKGILSQRRLQ